MAHTIAAASVAVSAEDRFILSGQGETLLKSGIYMPKRKEERILKDIQASSIGGC